MGTLFAPSFHVYFSEKLPRDPSERASELAKEGISALHLAKQVHSTDILFPEDESGDLIGDALITSVPSQYV
jgi:copper oxidase (laccase) domain-containing protein